MQEFNVIIKYLKDQGGQFWGAFSQSFSNAVKEARDRPLKEAMMKAQTAHQQAIADKAQMDIEQERQQQAAMGVLTNLLTTQQPVEVPTKIGGPVQGPVTETGEPPAPPPPTTTEMKNVEMTDPRVRAALLKSGVKGEVLSQAAKQAFPSGLSAGTQGLLFQDWPSLQAFMDSPAYMSAFPQGSRTVMTQHGIQLQGINPVDVAANEFHTDIANKMPREQALQKFYDKLYNKGAAAGAGGFAGKTAQEAQQPIRPMEQLPGTPTPPTPQAQYPTPPRAMTPTPAPSATTPTPPGQQTPSVHPGSLFSTPMDPNETQAQYVQRLRKLAQTSGSPLPATLEDVLAKGGTLEYLERQVRQNSTLPNGKLDPSVFSPFAGPTEMEYRQRFGRYAPYLGMSDKSLSAKETLFRQNLQSMKNLIVYLQTGKQINETEADRLNAVMPQPYDPKNFLTSLDRFKGELNAIMEEHRKYGSTTRGGLSQTQPTGQAPNGWEFTGK